MFSVRTAAILFVALFGFSFFTPKTVSSTVLTQCAVCHTDPGLIDELTEETIIFGNESETSNKQRGKGYRIKQAPFDLYEKVLVDEKFLKSTHGKIPCHLCHQGNPDSNNMASAHQGMLADPSQNSSETCGQCHADINVNAVSSLHMDPALMYGILGKRCSPDQLDEIGKNSLDKQCLSCHQGSCGSCHVSRPDVTGGGLQRGHFFNKKPDFVYNCLPCHTHPTGTDFIGENGRGDVHYRKYGMTCSSCHSGEELHASASNATDRFHLKQRAQCIDCHGKVTEGETAEHGLHRNVDCAVCHAAPYQNCGSCHTGKDQEGIVYTQSPPSFKGIKIGLNRDKDGPRYVLMREIGVQRDTFKDTVGVLKNFASLPTYKRASPHTIQRITWQSADCNNCHGNKDLFLTQNSIPLDLIVANRHVMLKGADIPATVEAKRSYSFAPIPPNSTIRVSAEWLEKHKDDKNLIVLDTRTKEDYEAGHIPGAYHLCFCLFRTGADSTPPYMMQPAIELAKIFGNARLGLTPEKRVVVYDDGHSGRGIAFLALRMIGHKKISFLDGNIDFWRKQGYKVAKGAAPKAKPKKYPLNSIPELLVDNQDITELIGERAGIVVDARIVAQHNGDMVRTSISKKGGAIPGSISFPLQALMDSEGKLYSVKRLAWLFFDSGITTSTNKTIVTTCNTNMLAAEVFMILNYLGFENVKVHDGSWAEWAAEFE